MLKIRLQRIGRKNDPSFRVVVIEHTRGPKSGDFVERVGSHNPKTKETTLNAERIKYWLGVGAQASGTMHNMLVNAGIIKADKVNVLPKKTPVVKEKEDPTSPEVADADSASKDDPAPDGAGQEPEEEKTEDAPVEKEKKDTGEEKENVQ